MSRVQLAVLGLAGLLAAAPAAQVQVRPYIGFVYPAGGQQGTTFRVRLGGQGLDDVGAAMVSGTGVSAKIVEYHRRLNNQELQLLREQLTELKRGSRGTAPTTGSGAATMATEGSMMASPTTPGKTSAAGKGDATLQFMARIEERIGEFVQRPACASLSNLVIVEVAMAPDAKPGQRELTLATPRGVTNPLVFHVGQLPEVSRKPMATASLQVLGKEELAPAQRDRKTRWRTASWCRVP